MEASLAQIYGVSIFLAFSMITSGTTGVISPSSTAEYYTFTFMSILGCGVWAFCISSACGILSTLDPHGIHFRHMMDELNVFAKEKNLPRMQTIRLREFLSQTAHVHRQARYNEVLDCMSSRLKADAALYWARETLLKVPFLGKMKDKIEQEFLASAALTLKSKVFCRTEQVSVESLLIIERGIAAKDGKICSKGACLGEDMVLNSLTFRDLNPAIALTFVVQTASLEKSSLESLLADYPLARREIRSASFKIAFGRAILQLAKVIKRKRAMGGNVSIQEAFIDVRRSKQQAMMTHVRLVEPTRKHVATSLMELAERTENIAKEAKANRNDLASQVRSLDTKLDAVIRAMGIVVPDPAAASQDKAQTGGWLESLVGRTPDKAAASGSKKKQGENKQKQGEGMRKQVRLSA